MNDLIAQNSDDNESIDHRLLERYALIIHNWCNSTYPYYFHRYAAFWMNEFTFNLARVTTIESNVFSDEQSRYVKRKEKESTIKKELHVPSVFFHQYDCSQNRIRIIDHLFSSPDSYSQLQLISSFKRLSYSSKAMTPPLK